MDRKLTEKEVIAQKTKDIQVKTINTFGKMKGYHDKLEKERKEKYQTIENINGKENIMKPYNYEKAAKSYRKAVEQGHMQHYNSTYKTARLISKITSFVGWVLIAVSIYFLVVFILVGINERGSGPFILAMSLAPIGGIIAGLFLVIAGQHTRATVDIADFNGEMLAIMKSGYVKDMSGNSENPKT